MFSLSVAMTILFELLVVEVVKISVNAVFPAKAYRRRGAAHASASARVGRYAESALAVRLRRDCPPDGSSWCR